MKANPGDRIILEAVTVDGRTREGEVIEAHGPGGSEPFLVRWSDGHTGLLYPGPGAVLHVEHPGESAERAGDVTPTASAQPPKDVHPRSHEWQVRINIFGSDDDTDAHVVLIADSPTQLTAIGHSHRGPQDRAVPEIADEVAVARALRRLADQLLGVAAGDIEGVTGEHDVTLRPR